MTLKSDDSYDGLPPPGVEVSPAATDLDYSVEMLLTYLESIALGDSVALNMSTALCSLQSAVTLRNVTTISEHQRDRLLKALVWAREPVLALLNAPAEKARAVKGVDAAAGLICSWSETDQQRAARHPHVHADLQARARWLRNACHNHCLLEEIDERASARRAEAVAELLRRAAA